METNSQVNAEVARYRYGVVVSRDSYLELKWFPTSSSMSDVDWMTGLMMLASEAEAAGCASILIDATEFQHTFQDRDGAMAWRDDNVIPRYNSAGVQRFAFIMPDGFPGPTAESGSEPKIDGRTADFPTQWFLNRANALTWLAG